ncbi:MAG TPA: hypothetical protein VM867_13075 [Xanthobacteraceae bacterium]|nr:hypothetical protein [Xanthobacteraceae bacterium]
MAIYTYTGNFFNEFSPEPGGVSGQYTSANRVTGWFSLAAALPNGFSGPVTPLDFSFTDGRSGMFPPLFGALGSASFTIQTDGAGQIVYWDISLSRSGLLSGPTRTIRTFGGFGEFSVDSGTIVDCIPTCSILPTQDTGRVEGAYGTWVVTETPVPGALPLFATGLGAIGALVWRRQRKTRTA